MSTDYLLEKIHLHHKERLEMIDSSQQLIEDCVRLLNSVAHLCDAPLLLLLDEASADTPAEERDVVVRMNTKADVVDAGPQCAANALPFLAYSLQTSQHEWAVVVLTHILEVFGYLLLPQKTLRKTWRTISARLQNSIESQGQTNVQLPETLLLECLSNQGLGYRHE